MIEAVRLGDDGERLRGHVLEEDCVFNHVEFNSLLLWAAMKWKALGRGAPVEKMDVVYLLALKFVEGEQ